MTLSDNMRGIWLMCASMLAFTLNDTFVKAVIGDGMPLSQAIVLRGAVATLGLLVIAARSFARLDPAVGRAFPHCIQIALSAPIECITVIAYCL